MQEHQKQQANTWRLPEIIAGGLTFGGVFALGREILQQNNVQYASNIPLKAISGMADQLEKLNINTCQVNLMRGELAALQDNPTIALINETVTFSQLPDYIKQLSEGYTETSLTIVDNIRNVLANSEGYRAGLENLISKNEVDFLEKCLNPIDTMRQKLEQTFVESEHIAHGMEEFIQSETGQHIQELQGKLEKMNELSQSTNGILTQIRENAQSLTPMQTAGLVTVAAIATAAVVFGMQHLQQVSQEKQNMPSARIDTSSHLHNGNLEQQMQQQVRH